MLSIRRIHKGRSAINWIARINRGRSEVQSIRRIKREIDNQTEESNMRRSNPVNQNNQRGGRNQIVSTWLTKQKKPREGEAIQSIIRSRGGRNQIMST